MRKFYSFIGAAAAILLTAGAVGAAGLNGEYGRKLSANSSTPGLKTLNANHHRAERPAMSLNAVLKAEAQGIEVPFTHSLGSKEGTADIYTVVDANNDTKTWKAGGFSTYSVCMKPTDGGIDAMDDWMISPAISLKAGVEYDVSIDARYVLSSGSLDKLDICLGADATPGAMTQTILAVEAKSKDWATFTGKFTVEADGLYYAGLHAISDKSTSGNLGACNFSISTEAADDNKIDPPAAGSFTYQVFPKGELKAHVTYTCPTLTKSGAPLEKIEKVQIINRWYEKFDYENPAPGEVIELDVDLFSGSANNRLQGTAYVLDAEGNLVAGEEALVTGIMAGPDYPAVPENIKVTTSADRKSVTVSWDPVGELGESGGYVDTEKLKYYLFDAFGSVYDPAIGETTETSYTFDYSDVTVQDFIAYQVTASYVASDGYEYASYAGVSDIVTFGPALAMPFKESFADAYYESVWATDPASSSNVMVNTVTDTDLPTNADDPDAEPEYLTSQDGDNGFLYLLPMNKDDMYGLISLTVDLSGAKNPVLEFYAQGKGSALDVLVGASIPEMEVVKTIDFQATPTDDWTLFRIPLADFKAAGAVNFELRLRAIHNDEDHVWSVPIDNIRVRDLVDNNLGIASLGVPAEVKAGENVTITARIENLGATESAATVAQLFRDGVKIGEAEVAAMQPDASTVVTFADVISIFSAEEAAYKVVVVNDGDEMPADNSAEVTVKVAYPAHPAVNSIDYTIDDNQVQLSWNPVSLDGLTSAVVVDEGFENPAYEPFAYENFGGWQTVDLDGEVNYTFLNDVNNPYRTLPMAYQIFNPVAAGVPEDYLIDCPTHNGDNMLVAWSCGSYNMNLLISPELSGEAQAVTFWAKGFTVAFPESFSVYVSTTGSDIADFMRFGDVEGYFFETENGQCVPEDWTEYTLNLPAGVKYFAIMHTSYDSYALFFDDFHFESGSVLPADTELVGYNVYRDGVKLNDEPLAESAYVDTPVDEAGEYKFGYQVTAVYNNAESRPGAPVEVALSYSGVEVVVADGVDASAEYYTIDGRRADAGSLVPGLYIRVSEGRAMKVIVK